MGRIRGVVVMVGTSELNLGLIQFEIPIGDRKLDI
jgi:hypothetical protein